MWDLNAGTELYDHFIDPEENYNRADDKEYAESKARLSKMLRAGWREALRKQQDDHNVPLPKQLGHHNVLTWRSGSKDLPVIHGDSDKGFDWL